MEHNPRCTGRCAAVPPLPTLPLEHVIVELGIFLPNTAPNASRQPILDSARIVDEGGLDSVWVVDRLTFPMVESLTTLAAVAGVTSRVKLGTSVLLGPTRDPALLAIQTASIDVLSAGRMILGLGVGSRAEDYTLTEQIGRAHV